MIRWLIINNDHQQTSSHHIHPFYKNMQLMNKRGLDQPYWLGISHEAFITFLAQSNISLSNISSTTLKTTLKEIQRAPIPVDFKNQLKRTLENEGLLHSKLEFDLLISGMGDGALSLSWESFCTLSSKGFEGVLQSIKACWSTLFRPALFKKIMSLESDLTKVNVSIVVRESQNEIMRGKSFSYSPRSPWDLRNSAVLYEKDGENYSFLVERSGFRTFYHGKKNELLDDSKNEEHLIKVDDHYSQNSNLKTTERQLNLPHDKVKKVAEYLQHLEKLLHHPIQFEWSMTSDQRITIRRIQSFDKTPSVNMHSSNFNTQTRNLWDQSLLDWNPTALLKPMWFSLLPRNFRTLSIHYIRTLGVKNKLSPDYEKVFRGFWGLLRGRLYINFAALHRYLGLGIHDELLEEIEVLSSLWMKQFDRESREAWDLRWPPLPLLSKRERRTILRKKEDLLSNWTEKVFNWIDKMHTLREHLVSTQWKEKNISLMLESFQQWEKQFVPSLVPILLAELQYRNLLSWYYEGSDKPSTTPSWAHNSDRKPISLSGNWFERRRQEKRFQGLEILSQMRPKYLSLLEDVYAKMRKFFELMGQKYRELGQLERADDIFYLTFEELLAFEEGRASTVSWTKLVEIRHEEYKKYTQDQKVTEVWMTTGLVGLASKFPEVIAIRSRKNPLFQSQEVTHLHKDKVQSETNKLNEKPITASTAAVLTKDQFKLEKHNVSFKFDDQLTFDSSMNPEVKSSIGLTDLEFVEDVQASKLGVQNSKINIEGKGENQSL